MAWYNKTKAYCLWHSTGLKEDCIHWFNMRNIILVNGFVKLNFLKFYICFHCLSKIKQQYFQSSNTKDMVCLKCTQKMKLWPFCLTSNFERPSWNNYGPATNNIYYQLTNSKNVMHHCLLCYIEMVRPCSICVPTHISVSRITEQHQQNAFNNKLTFVRLWRGWLQ